jgi:hypothetical protein
MKFNFQKKLVGAKCMKNTRSNSQMEITPRKKTKVNGVRKNRNGEFHSLNS